MPTLKEFERLGGLFNTASDQSRPFLSECSKTKFLAVSDYYRASDQYIKLAKETLDARELGIDTRENCQDCLRRAKSALESGQLDIDFVEVLENLRSKYLEEILKPALIRYIKNSSESKAELESIYLNALKIDGLIETIHFMNKVQPED